MFCQPLLKNSRNPPSALHTDVFFIMKFYFVKRGMIYREKPHIKTDFYVLQSNYTILAFKMQHLSDGNSKIFNNFILKNHKEDKNGDGFRKGARTKLRIEICGGGERDKINRGAPAPTKTGLVRRDEESGISGWRLPDLQTAEIFLARTEDRRISQVGRSQRCRRIGHFHVVQRNRVALYQPPAVAVAL